MPDPIVYDRRIFADNLVRFMKENREKQVDIARLLGVSKAAVSAYVKGEQMPRMDKLETLSQHFGVPISALIQTPGAAAVPDERENQHPAVRIFDSLNEAGQREYIRYGRFLTEQPNYRVPAAQRKVEYIKHFWSRPRPATPPRSRARTTSWCRAT